MLERDAHEAFCRYCQTGDPAAMARVFDLVAPRLLMLAGHLAPDRASAEDLVQGTFVDIIERCDRFDQARPLLPWLTGILAHRASHERRRARRRVDAEVALADDRSTPDKAAEAREFAEIVVSALAYLPEVYRDVLYLRLVQGLETRQIAQRLARPRETIKTQLARGLRSLRGRLEPRFGPALAVLLGAGTGLAELRAAVVGHAASAAGRPVPAAMSTSPARLATRVLVLAGVALTSVAVVWLGITALGALSAPVEPSTHAGGPGAATVTDAATETSTTADPELVREPAASAPLRVTVRHHDGAPAPGATVSFRPAGDHSWLRELRARTTAAGVATLPRELLSRAELWSVRTDRGDAPLRTDGSRGVELTIADGLEVSGVVLDATGGTVAGAAIWLVPADRRPDEGAVVATTDAEGRFAIPDVRAGSSVSALATGWAAPELAVVESSAPIVLQCRGRAPRIHGIVRDRSGRPINGAAVMLGWSIPPEWQPMPPPARLRTAADGSYSCGWLPAGMHVPIWVRAPGYGVTRHETGSLEAGAEHRVDVTLDDGASIDGTVTRGDRELGDVRIELRQAAVEPPPGFDFIGPGWGRPLTSTGDDGRFVLGGAAAGRATIRAVAEDGARTAAELVLVAGRTTRADLRLRPPAELRIRVVDDAGEPRPHWRVWVATADGERIEQHFETDTAGLVEVGGCEAGATYVVSTTDVRSVTVEEHLRHELVAGDRTHEIVFPDARAVAGYVECSLRTPDGALQAEAAFDFIRKLDAAWAHGKWQGEGEDGRFRAGALIPGRYIVAATAAAYGTLFLGEIEIGSGRTDLGEHTLREPGLLEVRAIDAGGRPSAVATVELGVANLPGTISIPLTAGRGQMRLQPGSYVVTYSGPDAALVREAVDVRSGATIPLELLLRDGVRQQLRIAGVERPRYVVFEWYRDGELCYDALLRLTAEDNRTFAVILEPGRYRIVARDELGREAVSSFAVTGERDEVVELRLPRGS